MFVALGLTIDLTQLSVDALVARASCSPRSLAFVVRPLVVGALLLPSRLAGGERLFVMWSGLKGAVPILLAALAVDRRRRAAGPDLRDRLRRRALLGGRPGDARPEASRSGSACRCRAASALSRSV